MSLLEIVRAAPKQGLAKKLAEWTEDDKTYRLVAVAKYTPGYEDNYVVELKTVGTLGEERWELRASWSDSDIAENRAAMRMIAALKSAQRESRGEVIEKVAAFVQKIAATVEDQGTAAALLAVADAVREGRPFQ